MKRLVVFMFVLTMVACAMGEPLSTRLSAYRLIDTASITDNQFSRTSYVMHTTQYLKDNADVDFREIDGSGKSTYVNGVEMIFSTRGDDNVTMTATICGAANFGPWETLFVVHGKAKTASASVGNGDIWFSDVSITDNHITTVVAKDVAEERVAKVAFDVTGYQFLKVFIAVTSSPSEVSEAIVNNQPSPTVQTWLRWY